MKEEFTGEEELLEAENKYNAKLKQHEDNKKEFATQEEFNEEMVGDEK